jgi:CTP:molybdopterin cytidylyltransferase MocA
VSVAGIILAAGESRRMGFPKALLRYREESFLDNLIGLFAARCQPVIVVLGAHAERIREGTLRPAVFVINADYQRGQTSSMQCGLRAVPDGAESVLFTLVDHPAVAPATLDALLAGRLQAHSLTGRPLERALIGEKRPQAGVDRLKPVPLLRVPRHQGRCGHPIWFSRELIAEFLGLPENGAAREIVRSHAAQTEFLDVDDAGILADIDDAEAYGRLTGAPL